MPQSGDGLATSVAIRLQANVDSKLAGRSGGVSRLGGVIGLRMTHSQRSSREIPEREGKCNSEATQAILRRRRVMG